MIEIIEVETASAVDVASIGLVVAGTRFVDRETKGDGIDSGPGPSGIVRDCVGCIGLTIEVDNVVDIVNGTSEEIPVLVCSGVTRTVVTDLDSLIVFVNIIVSVEGSVVLCTIVTVSVVSKLSVTVSITVAGEVGVEVVEPPSTGTTE